MDDDRTCSGGEFHQSNSVVLKSSEFDRGLCTKIYSQNKLNKMKIELKQKLAVKFVTELQAER